MAMVVGMFMGDLDIQIVSSSIASPGRAVGERRRDHLGADGLPDRRSHHDPFSGYLSRLLFDARSVRDLGHRLHAHEHRFALATSLDAMIGLRVLQGFIGGAMIPTVFATSFLLSGR